MPDLAHAEAETIRRCLGDVVALSTMPSVWAGAQPLRIAESLAAALYTMLGAEFVYVALHEPRGGEALLGVRRAETDFYQMDPQLAAEVGPALLDWARQRDPHELFVHSDPRFEAPVRVTCRQLGHNAEFGVVAVGFAGEDAPSPLHHLLINVSAEPSATTGLTNALLVHSLRQSEARFRTALEIRTVGAITFDPDGKLIDANDAFLSMRGYTRRDPRKAGGLSLQSLTAPEWRETVEKTLAELKEQGETTPIEKEYLRADGSRWWGLFAAKRLPDGQGFKFVVEITERKQAELALHEQTIALEALNRTAATTAIEKNLDRVVQTVTDAGVELSGAEFGAFFYNVVDPEGESYMLYTLSGVSKDAFAGFPMPRNTAVFGPTFNGEGIVRSDDIKLDPRYGQNAPRKGMPDGHLPVASYLAVPVDLARRRSPRRAFLWSLGQGPVH